MADEAPNTWLERLPVPAGVIRAGRYSFVNAALAELLGYSREAMTGVEFLAPVAEEHRASSLADKLTEAQRRALGRSPSQRMRKGLSVRFASLFATRPRSRMPSLLLLPVPTNGNDRDCDALRLALAGCPTRSAMPDVA